MTRNDIIKLAREERESCKRGLVAGICTCRRTEQEPVAWLDEEINCAYTPEELDGGSAEGLLPLYTTPPRREWVGLTDNEIWDCAPPFPDDVVFARAIEAALKERNA